MSLLQRLMLLILLLIIPVLGVETANNIYLKNERVAAVHNQAERLAALVDDEHARMFEGMHQLLNTWAESPVLRTRDMAGCQEMAERLRVKYPAYLVLGATNETGVVQCATSRSGCRSAIVSISVLPGKPTAWRPESTFAAGTTIDQPCPLRCPITTRWVLWLALSLHSSI
jgi:hypothetical protein